MKIAFIGIKSLPSSEGAGRVVQALVTRLRDRHQITVYCSARTVPKGSTFPGVKTVRIPSLPGKHLHAASLFLGASIHAVLAGRYRLVHLHNVEASFVLPLLRLRFPVVSTSHGSAYARDKWGGVAKTIIKLTERPFIRLSSAVTSVSDPLAAEYRQRYGREVIHIPNGIDTPSTATDGGKESAAPDDAILAKHGLEKGAYLLFAAGRVDPTKGCHLLLEAFSQLNSDTELIVVGNTAHAKGYREELEELANSRVRFIPFVASKEELFALVRSCRLFVFPSTVEAMSMMLLEAASLGAPILCSDIPENRAVLPAESLFFKTGDVADLREKLAFALDHPKDMAKLAELAQDWVMIQFDWNKIVDSYHELYETVASG